MLPFSFSLSRVNVDSLHHLQDPLLVSRNASLHTGDK